MALLGGVVSIAHGPHRQGRPDLTLALLINGELAPSP
jgi:hypothetical protein